MINIQKYAAVDIGSNAVRLLISSVISQNNDIVEVKKISLVRVPIRLGLDGFLNNKIKKDNTIRLIDAMNAFKLLMKIHNVSKYKVCATSAMREAANSEDVINKVYSKTGLEIDVISGKDEASLIADTFFANHFNFKETYLFIDIGGGSTELSIIFKGIIIASKSFKIGTIRFLNDLVTKKTWSDYKKWIKSNTKDFKNIIIIGSGGNINKILKESNKDINESISYSFIDKFYNKISNLTYEERITKLGYNPDRSDVIVPATRVLIKSMQYAKSKKLIVPRIGLADGIIRKLNNVVSFGGELKDLNA
ncbi:exopolyphosphatase [Flavobacteriaceae bacterium]|nr:exopolyphosphatase [Flavobacteriaceae bacterium]MDC1491817.1 exopolyphosphatase [Flavobacteriaceae bacterium]